MGLEYEWRLHNTAYTIGTLFDIHSITNSSKSVDVGKGIFSDKHIDGITGVASHFMKISWIILGNPIFWIFDLIANGGYSS